MYLAPGILLRADSRIAQDDQQKLTRLLRSSEGGLQIGYVLFVNGELEKMPEGELAMDCVLPEGPPNQYEIVASLFNCIPREADHNAELWTTVDKDKTNVRAKVHLLSCLGCIGDALWAL